MVRCCAHNRRSDGGRRPPRGRRPRPLAGRAGCVAGPGRGPVRPGGATTAGPGVRAGAAGRPATQELPDDRRARRGAQPDGLQHLLARASWNHDGVRDDVRAYVAGHLGDPGAVLVVDEAGDLKKGTGTVGVPRQYTATAGRVENAQVAVLLVDASPAGHAVIDREPSLPRSWARDPERLRAAGVPLGWGLRPSPPWPPGCWRGVGRRGAGRLGDR
jgi:hypothetical protein